MVQSSRSVDTLVSLVAFLRRSREREGAQKTRPQRTTWLDDCSRSIIDSPSFARPWLLACPCTVALTASGRFQRFRSDRTLFARIHSNIVQSSLPSLNNNDLGNFFVSESHSSTSAYLYNEKTDPSARRIIAWAVLPAIRT